MTVCMEGGMGGGGCVWRCHRTDLLHNAAGSSMPSFTYMPPCTPTTLPPCLHAYSYPIYSAWPVAPSGKAGHLKERISWKWPMDCTSFYHIWGMPFTH